MSDRVVIDADLKFVEGIINAGGQDLKKCYQCSTCTVVCPLTPEGAPFPRKEMMNAQWGIKDKLLKSMDAWLCYHCGDCSDQCPRGAKPGDVMAAIRNMIIANVAVPSVFGRMAQSLGGSLVLLLIPIILLAAVIFGVNGGEFGFLAKTPINFTNMIHQVHIELVYLPALAFAVVTAFLGIRNLLAGLKEEYPPDGKGESLVASLIGTLTELITHEKFKECGINRDRNIAHMLLFYSFVGLALTTAGVTGIYYINLIAENLGYAAPLQATPLPFLHPVKILGNISALAAVIGICLIAGRRLFSQTIGTSVAFDWIFIGNLVLVIATGILAQVARVAEMSPLAYIIYYCHLVFVFFLIAFIPHSKFGHMIYRVTALVYARYSGRSQSVGVDLLEATKQEALPEETKGAA
ncbi:MAG: 4Fe-4S dicluster domain-containing protein [Proteobacteria bacterium]|nr:4Fe-4S dicluster domain-containing protein [Pseudomonadota bacterium]